MASRAACAADTQHGEWPYYGGDAASSKYSPLSQIDASNVKTLEVAWTWDSPDNALAGSATREHPGSFKATPLMIEGVLYTSTAFNEVAAIDPASGTTLWTFDPRAYASGRRPTNSGWQHRGVAYWSGKVGGRTQQRIVIATGIGDLIALDARTR
jgi:quinoprotein glucose dehydrogenase